jgi:hypothetical protein
MVSLSMSSDPLPLPQDLNTDSTLTAYPHGHYGIHTGSWKKETKTAWGDWTSKPESSPSVSITNDGTPTTSTIHTTSTDTAITRRDEEHKSHSHRGMGSSWTIETGISKPTVSFMGTKSWTKTDSGMTTITVAAREEAHVDDSCTMVFFKGGGFCLPASKTERGDDLMTHSRHHSHHQSDVSLASTSLRGVPGHGGKHTSKEMVSATVTSMMAPPTSTMPTMSGYPAGMFHKYGS